MDLSVQLAGAHLEGITTQLTLNAVSHTGPLSLELLKKVSKKKKKKKKRKTVVMRMPDL